MNRFERLSRLNGYTIDKHQPDPRGWDIVNSEHHRIGEVRDLIVDTSTMKAIYLDVELDAKQFDMRGDPRVMVPIERADRHGDHKHLVLSGFDSARVQELCSDRARHYYEFWDRWWQRDSTQVPAAAWSPTISQQLSADDLRRALDNAQPGEQVRIPVVNEEIVIVRRPLNQDDDAVAPASGRPVLTQNVK